MAPQEYHHATRVHVVLFAFPLKGHIQPALTLAHRIHSQHASLTFVSAHYQIASIPHGCYPFRLVGFSEEEPRPPDFHPDSVAGITWAWRSAYRMKNSFERLITELTRVAKSAVCVVSDHFLDWTRDVAEQFHLPWYAFHPASASYLALQFYVPTILSDHRRLSSPHHCDQHDVVTHFLDCDGPVCVPGIGCLEVDDLPQFLRNNFPLASHHIVAGLACNLHKAAGVLVNTYEEMEKCAYQTLCGNSNLNPNMVEIFPVGPCLPVADTSEIESVSKPEVQGAINWLNDQEASSVLYVCFGSLFIPSFSQIQELALGLEASGHPFFWVLRSPTSTQSESCDLHQILPAHFLSRTRKQGKVFAGWAPQLQILSHSSVGGFLSHCGWNSTLESTAMGVPILAFPQMADQMLNARLLSEELKVALVLGKGPQGLVQRCQIERAVRNLMEDCEIRKRAKELQIVARRAIAEDRKSLEAFLQRASLPFPSQQICESQEAVSSSGIDDTYIHPN